MVAFGKCRGGRAASCIMKRRQRGSKVFRCVQAMFGGIILFTTVVTFTLPGHQLQTMSLLQYNNSNHSKELDLLVDSPFPAFQRPKFLWGIISDATSEGFTWRQNIRQSYLSYYNTTMNSQWPLSSYHSIPTNGSISLDQMICSFNEFIRFIESSQKGNANTMQRFRSCRIFYVFVLPSPSNIQNRSNEADVLHVHSNNKEHIPLEVAWLKFASQLDVDTVKVDSPQFYIALVDMNSVVLPPVFLDAVDSAHYQMEQEQVTSYNPALTYGSTPYVSFTKCLRNATYFRLKKKRCQQPTGQILFAPQSLVKHAAIQWETTIANNPNSKRIKSMHEETPVHLRDMLSSFSNAEFMLLPRVSKVLVPEDILPRWDTLSQLYNTSSVQDQWADHFQPNIQSIIRRRLIHITAKFGRQPREFASEVTNRRADLLLHAGLDDPSTQIYSYDTFPSFIINDGRWKKDHLEFTRNATISNRGGGYWFFKAPLVEHFVSPRDGSTLTAFDFFVYTDADQQWEDSVIPRIIKTMLETNTNFAIKQSVYLEREYTKRDAYRVLCSKQLQDDPDFIQTDTSFQYAGGWMVLKRSDDAIRQFVREWSEWVALDFATLLSDTPSKMAERADFVEHRHDQSLMNLFLKCRREEKPKVIVALNQTGLREFHLFRME